MGTRLEMHENFDSQEHDRVTVSVDNTTVHIIIEVDNTDREDAPVTDGRHPGALRELARLTVSHSDFDTIARIVGRYRKAAPHAGAEIEGSGQ